MGGGTQQSTSSSTPPANFLNAYDALMSNAGSIANQPLQQYTGNTVAGLSTDQQGAINTIDQSQGIANPYINAAAAQYGQATTPLTTQAPQIAQAAGQQATGIAGQAAQTANGAASTNVWNQIGGPVGQSQINQYESPYTQQVVNSTQQEFNNQNAQQNQGIVGNAISSGAWGGDRASVAQGIAAGQEQLAQAPVIAGLENTGYSQALGEANTQQALQANLGQSQAQLEASTALGAGNLGATTALGAGNLGIAGAGQQLSADQASAWLNMQAGSGLAGLGNEAQQTALTGANAQMGAGTTEQTLEQNQLNVPYQQFQQQQAYPFETTQWLTSLIQGLGSSAGGSSQTTSPGPSALSQIIGGVGAAGSLASLFAARGGAIKRASGGGIAAPPDVSITYVPVGGGIKSGGGPPKAPSAAKQQNQFAGAGKAAEGIGAFKDALTPDDDMPDLQSTFAPNDGSGLAGNFGGMPLDASALEMPTLSFKRGGGIARFASGGAPSSASSFVNSLMTKSGISLPQLSTTPSTSKGIAVNLTSDYGSDPNNSDGTSKLPSSTYWPSVDPWWSNNPANHVANTAPGAPKGSTVLDPSKVDPTMTGLIVPKNQVFNQSVGQTGSTDTSTSTDPNLQAIISEIEQGQFKRGGGISKFAEGGYPDDDADPEAYDGDDDPANGEPPVSRETGAPFAAYPMETQPKGAAIATPKTPAGIAAAKLSSAGASPGTTIPGAPDAAKSKGIALSPDDMTSAADFAPSFTPHHARDSDDEPESKNALKMSLLAASLGTLAGHSHFAMENIGAGGLEGLKMYQGLTGKAADRSEKEEEREDTDNRYLATAKQNAAKFSDQINDTRLGIKSRESIAANASADRAAALKQKKEHDDAVLAQGHYDVKIDPTTGAAYKVNTKTGETSGVSMPGGGGGAAGAQTDKDGKPLSGDEFLASIAPDRAAAAKARSEGRLAMPVGMYLKTPAGQRAQNDVLQYDPSADATTLPMRTATRKAFASGTEAKKVTSLNTVMGHVDHFEQAADALNNGKMPLANTALNFLAQETGDPRMTDFHLAQNAIADEVANTFRAVGSSEGEAKRWYDQISASGSPAQLKQIAHTLMPLFKSRIDALQDQYQRGMGAKAPPLQLLSPQNEKLYEKYAMDSMPGIPMTPDGKGVDRTKISPTQKYRTSAGPKLGSDLLSIGAQ